MNAAASVRGAALAAAVEAYHSEKPLSGVVRISDAHGVVLEVALGAASLQLGVANQPDTKFHIASLTKMFIAAAVQRLVDDGALNLDAHPGLYDPAFEAINPRITLHHLLSNTSGLADIYRIPDLRIVAEQLAAEGRSVPAYLASMEQLFAPGDRWSYSSTGFLILAYVAMAATSRPFGTILEELFFSPLGMIDTGEDNPRSINPGRAQGHFTRDGRDWNAENDKLVALDAPRELYSTVRDLDLWGRAIFDGRVLSAAAAQRAFTSYASVDFDPSLGYGYGWFLGDGFRLIGGGTPGFRSEMWQFPNQQMNVIMLWTNAGVDSHALFRSIRPLLGL